MEELRQAKCIHGAIDLLSGDEIDMVLFQYLASGSFGTVLLGELSKRKGDGSRKQVICPAAVKSLRQSPPNKRQNESSADEDTHQPSEVSPLIYEADILSELSHKNILSFEALVRPRGCDELYLATEYVEGPSLHSLLEKQSGLPVNQKLYSDGQAGRWMLGLASALEFMHSQPDDITVIHRDISVNNILLTSHNLKKAEAKLIDFGLAVKISRNATKEICGGSNSESHAQGCSCPECNSTYGQSRVGQRLNQGCGTYLHMAPEMLLQGMTYGPEVDVFSFGMVLYQVFQYTSIKTILHRSGYTIHDGHDAMLNGWRPAFSDSCPPTIRSIIQQCWEMNPVDRPEFREIVQTLKDFCSSVSDGSPSIRSRVMCKLRFSLPTAATAFSMERTSEKAKMRRNKSAPDLTKHDLDASRIDSKGGISTMNGTIRRTTSMKSVRKALTRKEQVPQFDLGESGQRPLRSKSAFDVTAGENRKHDAVVEQFASASELPDFAALPITALAVTTTGGVGVMVMCHDPNN